MTRAKREAKVVETCSFCGLGRQRVRWLVASHDSQAFICDVCILLAVHALADKLAAGVEL